MIANDSDTGGTYAKPERLRFLVPLDYEIERARRTLGPHPTPGHRHTVEIGTRVQVVGLQDTATLVRVNDCRAIVREERTTEVSFTDSDGEVRQFTSDRSHLTSWSPNIVLEPIGFESQTNENEDMATGTKKGGSTKASPKAKSGGNVSALDADAKVLWWSQGPVVADATARADRSSESAATNPFGVSCVSEPDSIDITIIGSV